jgi:hypothetical protein
MEDALEQAVREINQAYTSDTRITREGLVAILRRYYKNHTIEILEMLESQHQVSDLLTDKYGEGTI